MDISSKYTRQVNVKLSPELLVDLEDVASYEGVKIAELLRNWIRDKVRDTKQTRSFQNWIKKREGKLEEEAATEEGETNE